ncbi:hypothetical protein Lal_00030107 [Lupinus albus]|nr:hypothetical protein Lal_00030107 [Lupinus albus]
MRSYFWMLEHCRVLGLILVTVRMSCENHLILWQCINRVCVDCNSSCKSNWPKLERNTNHSQPKKNDLKLMFTIRGGILVNFPAEILKIMIIDHLEIDTSYVDFIVTNSHEHLISDNLIHKIIIYKYGES